MRRDRDAAAHPGREVEEPGQLWHIGAGAFRIGTAFLLSVSAKNGFDPTTEAFYTGFRVANLRTIPADKAHGRSRLPMPLQLSRDGFSEVIFVLAVRYDMLSRQQFERRGAKAQEDGDKTRQLMDKESGKVEYVFNAWMNSGSVDAVKQLRMFTNNLLKLAYDVGGLQGVMRENVLYMQEYDKRLTAAGGERTRQAVLGEVNAN